MEKIESVIGWTSAYLSDYPTVSFTANRKNALINRIKKRAYNFNYNDHQMLPFCAPFYADNTICVLTKKEWDEVISLAYSDYPIGPRLLPDDVITRKSINGVLYEKEKFEPKE